MGPTAVVLLHGFPQSSSVWSADVFTDAMLQPGGLTAAISWYRAPRLRSSLAVGPITVPTLYVWSTGDVALGRVAAESTCTYVEGPYRFEVLKGTSHWIPETRVEQLTALLLDHLRTYPASRAPAAS